MKYKLNKLCIFICFIMLVMIPNVLLAEELKTYVHVNEWGFIKNHPYTPVKNIDNRILLPLRATFDQLLAKVTWDGNRRKITVNRGADTLILKVDSEYATINGKQIKLDVPPRIIENKTFVPIRFISETLGDKVEWNLMSTLNETMIEEI